MPFSSLPYAQQQAAVTGQAVQSAQSGLTQFGVGLGQAIGAGIEGKQSRQRNSMLYQQAMELRDTVVEILDKTKQAAPEDARQGNIWHPNTQIPMPLKGATNEDLVAYINNMNGAIGKLMDGAYADIKQKTKYSTLAQDVIGIVNAKVGEPRVPTSQVTTPQGSTVSLFGAESTEAPSVTTREGVEQKLVEKGYAPEDASLGGRISGIAETPSAKDVIDLTKAQTAMARESRLAEEQQQQQQIRIEKFEQEKRNFEQTQKRMAKVEARQAAQMAVNYFKTNPTPAVAESRLNKVNGIVKDLETQIDNAKEQKANQMVAKLQGSLDYYKDMQKRAQESLKNAQKMAMYLQGTSGGGGGGGIASPIGAGESTFMMDGVEYQY